MEIWLAGMDATIYVKLKLDIHVQAIVLLYVNLFVETEGKYPLKYVMMGLLTIAVFLLLIA